MKNILGLINYKCFMETFYVRNGEVHEIPENTDGWGQTVYSTGDLKAEVS